ncbi:ferritin-like fold-containing protein [Cellulomonas oligotrophica]|uniref:Ferritin-like domain-containing protein n=1 Tax=Cellulomonas oligotrophica TaxID=931536 RepID=A0A7Y9FE57_9CELL|nr:ferritin-like fold-containing protein [Cellulomonas oligotrophica]NYD85357.1 hypothetical protein [Cellulomonas oligotrophica]GIG33208.1 hypothetical protein Col01nite_23670 [Cellulomonas oligotrophica]
MTTRADDPAAPVPPTVAGGTPPAGVGPGTAPVTGQDAADAVEVLGLVAALEHRAFVRLAADTAQAPDVEQALALSRFAAACTGRRDRVLARIDELGGDPVAALARFDQVLDEFDDRTPSSTWWERLLKAYVGYGVADDFCRLASRGLDPRSRDLVAELLEDASHAELVVRELDRACADDEVLTSRLALWGRRLVGEALNVVQRVVQQRPGVARAVDRATADELAPQTAPVADVPAQAPARVINELTAEHTRRMSRLHLTA